MSDEIVVRGFIRNYRRQPVKDRHDESVSSSYCGVIHDTDSDELIDRDEALRLALYQIPEGEIVEIILRRTGEQSPFADDPWVLQKAHTYGLNSEVACATEPVDGGSLK